MLLDTDMSIALKNIYGTYDINNFSLFETDKINRSFTSLKVKVRNNKEIIFKIKCPICGKYHSYKYGINEFIKRRFIVGGCEALGTPLFYIGTYDKVMQKVNQVKNINKQVYAMI
jgi:hypothetical protein